MSFDQRLQGLIYLLETAAEGPEDPVLQKVIALLRASATEGALRKNAALIVRISLDGVKRWETLQTIAAFVEPYLDDCVDGL